MESAGRSWRAVRGAARYGVLLATATCFCPGDGATRVRGGVVEGAPGGPAVAGARVVLAAAYHSRSDSAVTIADAGGGFAVQLIHVPSANLPLVLRVTKPGYRPFVRAFTAGQAPRDPVPAVLTHDPSAAAR